ncbi:MAG: RidA family protein [Bacteroidota bacterium]
MQIIDTLDMPKGNGHYSQCIEHNGVLYLSGQLPMDRSTKAIPDGIEAQTDLVLQNVEEILKAAGTDRNAVLQVRIYVSDIELWGKVNERYSSFFGAHKPVRCIIPTRDLHYGALIEVEVTAVADNT